MKVSCDHRWIISGSDDKTIRIWNFERRNQLGVYLGNSEVVWSVCLSEDGRCLGSEVAIIRQEVLMYIKDKNERNTY